MSYDPDGKTHVCENCRKNTELFHFRPVDEYWCDECIGAYHADEDMPGDK